MDKGYSNVTFEDMLLFQHLTDTEDTANYLRGISAIKEREVPLGICQIGRQRAAIISPTSPPVDQ